MRELASSLGLSPKNETMTIYLQLQHPPAPEHLFLSTHPNNDYAGPTVGVGDTVWSVISPFPSGSAEKTGLSASWSSQGFATVEIEGTRRPPSVTANRIFKHGTERRGARFHDYHPSSELPLAF